MLLLLSSIDRRLATVIRLAGLAAIVLSVLRPSDHAVTDGRGVVVGVLLAAVVISWLVWTLRPEADRGVTFDLYVMAAAGGLLVEASPRSAASGSVFVAVIVAGLRAELTRAAPVALTGVIALAVSDLLYNSTGLGLLAYALGLAAALMAGSTARQRTDRTEQAELLLAQTQRSHEEQLRSARLEESTRIAREIHDVLAHTLAGLSIQLEATSSLVQQGADRDTVLARVQRAHELAREGLQETRRAVGALRGEGIAAPAGIKALVDEYHAGDAPAQLKLDGDPARLSGPTGQAVLRVVQEALTNVRKHAPGAEVSVTIHAGSAPGDEVVVVVDDRPVVTQPAGATAVPAGAVAIPAGGAAGLAATGGGYGLEGMRERAQLLGGTLSAGAADGGWRVELRLPAPPPPATTPAREDRP